MPSRENHQDCLRQIMSRPEAEINLAEAALVIARAEYPQLDIADYLHGLDRLAASISERIAQQATMTERLEALNRCLFEEEGFQGNVEDYYDPRNSFLNEVMDRRCGIPITLSLIYIEIGRRIGLPLEGVSFPGHFLVKLPVHNGAIVFDAYAGGVSLSEAELEQRLERFYSAGERSRPTPQLAQTLVSASKRGILARMLRNLKGIYVHGEAYDKALAIVDQLIVVSPDTAIEWRDRGIIHERLECFRAAQEDYHRYLALEPAAEDAESVRERLLALAPRCRSLH